MATTYHVTTSDRTMHHIKAHSAVEAISKALERNRGLMVTECFAGDVIAGDYPMGRITFDVPAHKPLPPRPDEP